MVDQIYMKQKITAQVKGKCNYVLKMLPPPPPTFLFLRAPMVAGHQWKYNEA